MKANTGRAIAKQYQKAPFIWYGGKRRVASEVWAAMGPEIDHYIEPFFGTGAVLLKRPGTRWRTGAETVNDLDCYLVNFWRAVQADPKAVAKYADWPVTETDKLARHLWLVNEGRDRVAKLEADPEYYDVKVAGWWVWGINIWIGSGWCSGNGPWQRCGDKVVQWDGGGVSKQRPHMGPPRGVNRKLPHLGSAGQGVNRQLPWIGGVGRGTQRSGTRENLIAYFDALADRLRRVRICCGDWARVVTDGVTSYGNRVGVFLDPPYLGEVRCSDLYRVDDHGVANAVREWALAHGSDKRFRIVLAGYEDEHIDHMPASWRMMKYSGGVCYQTHESSERGDGNAENRHKERLWFSPHCLGFAKRRTLFDR